MAHYDFYFVIHTFLRRENERKFGSFTKYVTMAGCIVQKKTAGQQASSSAPLRERLFSLSSDLKRLQLRDLSKHGNSTPF